jgi:hypothetical protein
MRNEYMYHTYILYLYKYEQIYVHTYNVKVNIYVPIHRDTVHTRMSTGYERVCNYSIQVKRHNDKYMNIDYINVSVWIYVYILIYKNTWDMHICTSSNVNTYENTHTLHINIHVHT